MPARPHAKLWNWLRSHPYTLAAAVAFVVVGLPFCLRRDSEWVLVYLRAADHLRRGEDFYRIEEGYLYPPFLAWAALPFLSLPAAAVRPVWLLINLACLVLFFRWSWRLAGGGRLQGGPAPPGEHLAAVLGAGCAVFYLQNCLAHQQTDIVGGTLLLAGCVLLSRGRSLAAASCFGVAAAFKCTPLLWAPYLVWRGRARAAAVLVAVALGVSFLPDLVRPSPFGRPWLVVYAERFLQPLASPGYYLGTWGSDLVYNQSLAGAGQRWLTTACRWTADDWVMEVRHDRMGPWTLRAVVYGAEALLLLVVVWVVGRPLRRVGREPADGEVGRQALEYSVVLLLMLLLSPMSSKAHFGLLLLPGFCLARVAVARRDYLLGALVVLAVLMGALSGKELLGERLYTLTLWCGSATWGTLVLLVGCLVLLRRQAKADALRLPCPAPESAAGMAA